MAWELLFNSDIGLASLAVIVGVVVIGYGMGKLYVRNMQEDARK